MAKYKISLFRQYPFRVGQKIRIDDGPRRGDWEVVDVGERKVKLRCPVSLREFEWNRFCYLVEEKEAEWPQQD
ncbi:MAG: hypothetical protein JRJ12_16910 [Deltaproteobacteria bacterium]|nr:hypothetical protein [Deltaproteobacteria bacterium]